MKAIISGLKHIHSKGIAHRDIKIDNILIEQGKFKICDFGSASFENFDFKQASKAEIG